MRSYMKLVHRLGRLLKAKQLPYWLYDQEEGHLNPYMLTRVVAAPSVQMTYVREKITDFRPTLFYFAVDGSETDDIYEFIYDFALAMERAGAVATEIQGVKDYKERIRGKVFDRSQMAKTVFDLKRLERIKFKRKIVISTVDYEIKLPISKFNALFHLNGIDDTENLLNSLYDYFDKD